jgi:hypothetical protein
MAPTSTRELDDRPKRRWSFRPSVWTFVAPAALAACVLVIFAIARDAGWTERGHTSRTSTTSSSGGATQTGGAILYRAKKGETLMVIAVRFGISLDSLRALNPKLPADGKLPVGRRIRLR